MPEIQAGSSPKETKMPADLSDDSTELLLEASLGSHNSLMHDTRGNEQSAHNILRHNSVRQQNEVDPLEAAATEMILGKAMKAGA